MRFTQDSSSAAHVIRAYRQGELKIDAETFHGSVIVSASVIESVAEIHNLDALADAETARLIGARMLALQPELVLLGTGARQVFPTAEFRSQFLRAGVGVEAMDSGAACRTFNVLVAERRRVVALVLV